MENNSIFFGNISAINAAQVKVTFSNTLTGDTKDEATDLDNYTLNNSKGNEIEDAFKAVDVEEGSKEAILTVDFSKIGDGDDDYQNQADFELVLNKDITGEETKKEFKVSDFDIPEVESAEVAGIRTIKVKLSEPVVSKARAGADLYKDLENAFEVNDGDYSIEKVEAINNGKELNIVLYSDLKDGEKLTVEVKSEAEDYAGYSLKKSSHDVTVDINKDDVAVVGYEKAKDSEITLVFNKDVKFHDYEDETKLVKTSVKDQYAGYKDLADDNDVFGKFYHTTSKNEVEAVEIDGNKVTLHFASDDLLPETAYIFVDSDALEDLWNKTNNDLNQKVTITKDSTKPEIKELKQDDDSNRKVVITFTEELDKESAEKESNYTVTDKDGKTVRVSDAKLTDEEEVTLTLSKDLDDSEKYKVAIEDVEDKAGNKISDVTKEFTAKETEAVTSVTARYYDQGKSSQKVVIDFDTKMLADGSRYAINNLDNYDLKVVKGGQTYTLNLADYDDASIKSVEDAHKAEIKLPGNDEDLDDRFDFTGATVTVTINKVDDINENRSEIISNVTVNPKATNIGLDSDNDAPIAVDTETVKVIFDDELSFEKDDVQIGYMDAGTFTQVTPSSTRVDKENGKTTVTYTLKEADQLQYDGTYAGDKQFVVKTIASPESENSYGDTLAASQTWNLKDEIVPVLAKLAETSGGDATATVKFDVALDDRDDYEDAVKVVNYNSADKTASVELTFQEELTNANINKYVFKTDDDDVDVTAAALKDGDAKTVVLTLDASGDGYTAAADFVGLGISTGSNELFDTAAEANKAVVDAEIEIVDTDAIDAIAAKEAAKTALNAKITAAQQAHDVATEGAVVGNTIVGSKATLQTAITAAQAVYNNAAATTAQLTQATTDLNTAVTTFEASKVVALTGLTAPTGLKMDAANGGAGAVTAGAITGVTAGAGETLEVTSGDTNVLTINAATGLDVTGKAAGTATVTVKVLNTAGEVIKVGTVDVTVGA
ncbi:Ig-like domain-containing protein [Clostridium ganghwense]|uniref:Ig-like domain-containing protein n=1 Tax=Clostridium ganghwense TaxID=312089 RepID=A0ABT4CPL6_9CLOT|nr:Ig-like domain-containing protein [Clostridium ganghwense]MCY6370977.1 Ig-like domain-containing protein [Clostridium ganghwense]